VISLIWGSRKWTWQPADSHRFFTGIRFSGMFAIITGRRPMTLVPSGRNAVLVPTGQHHTTKKQIKFCIVIFYCRAPVDLIRPLVFTRFFNVPDRKKIRAYSHPVAGSHGRPMCCLSGNRASWNTAKGKLFSGLSVVFFRLRRYFGDFSRRWTTGLPDRVHRSIREGNGG